MPTKDRVLLRDEGVFTMGFGGRANHGAHVGLVFIGHRFPRLIDHGSRSDVRAFPHVDPLAGN